MRSSSMSPTSPPSASQEPTAPDFSELPFHVWFLTMNWRFSFEIPRARSVCITPRAIVFRACFVCISLARTYSSRRPRFRVVGPKRSIVVFSLLDEWEREALKAFDITSETTNSSMSWDPFKQSEARCNTSGIVSAENVIPSFITTNLSYASNTWDTSPELLSYSYQHGQCSGEVYWDIQLAKWPVLCWSRRPTFACRPFRRLRPVKCMASLVTGKPASLEVRSSWGWDGAKSVVLVRSNYA